MKINCSKLNNPLVSLQHLGTLTPLKDIKTILSTLSIYFSNHIFKKSCELRSYRSENHRDSISNRTARDPDAFVQDVCIAANSLRSILKIWVSPKANVFRNRRQPYTYLALFLSRSLSIYEFFVISLAAEYGLVKLHLIPIFKPKTAELVEARSFPYRSQMLQPNTHFAAFSEIYKIHILWHRSNLKILQKCSQTFCRKMQKK